jgi:CheY-like chemotaxis protein
MPPEQGGQIPAIALSAYVSQSDSEQALSAGFQKHLAKPVEPAELIAVVLSIQYLSALFLIN